EATARGVADATAAGCTAIIIDTAGRSHVDEEMMREIIAIRDAVQPHESLLVVDAMTGQEAVNAAAEFHERVGLTGFILTKLDGDARGGAALSIRSVTGLPVKFVGAGEKIEALEPFYPDRFASRILGMGDVLGLVERAQQNIGEDGIGRLEEKMKSRSFDMQDFLEQYQSLRKMGSLQQLLAMVPGLSLVKSRIKVDDIDDAFLTKVEAMILSMTPDERRNPAMINGSRRKRIARGSGTTPQDVNQLLSQFREVQKIMQMMTSGKFSLVPGLKFPGVRR
ncbi:MAG TPA: signal recognition particle protein, partial [Dehalococcoidia bacterium]|nr:signal recognition particle protein [Dehalococcoidia bacterium]